MADASHAQPPALPRTNLRGFTVDPRLWHYVPLAYARERRVVPVTLVGDRLHVAVAHPGTDLSVLRRRLPNVVLELHLASVPELDAVLADTLP